MGISIIFILGVISFTLMLIRLVIVIINCNSDIILNSKVSQGGQNKKVSIIIPARNEEQNIANLLLDISNLDYHNLEVIVYNDQSEDNTKKEVLKFDNSRITNLKVIDGLNIEKGWLGKNFACHNASLQAKGEYFLFLDADIKLHPQAINTILNQWDKHKGLVLLSLFPSQITLTISEQIIVPIMHYILLSLLPLKAILRFKYPSLAAANGQFMFFDAQDYKDNQYHKQVKNIVVEDIAIQRIIKQNGKKTMTLLGGKLVLCRMYQNFNESILGFSKNLFAGFGYNLPMFMLIHIIELCGVFFVANAFSYPLTVLYIMAIALIKYLIMQMGGYKNPLLLTLYQPFMIVFKCYIAIQSVMKYYLKKQEWKGRNISA